MLVNHLLDEYNEEAEIEKQDSNTLANSSKQELNNVEGLSSTKAKGIKLTNLVKEIRILYLGKGERVWNRDAT